MTWNASVFAGRPDWHACRGGGYEEIMPAPAASVQETAYSAEVPTRSGRTEFWQRLVCGEMMHRAVFLATPSFLFAAVYDSGRFPVTRAIRVHPGDWMTDKMRKRGGMVALGEIVDLLSADLAKVGYSG